MICALCGDPLYLDDPEGVARLPEGLVHFDCADEASEEEGWLPFHLTPQTRPVVTVAWL